MAEPNCNLSPSSYRLSPYILPHHYDLDIITNLDPPDNFTFEGTVEIKIECFKAEDTIKVHARSLVLSRDEVSVKKAGGKGPDEHLQIKKTEIDVTNDFLVIELVDPLLEGEMYIVKIQFQGKLKENLIGYYRSSYLERSSNTTKWLAVTHFEPTEARQAFPCFDEPTMKATFTIRLAHKDHFSSISNMPIMKTVPFEGKPGWVWNEFQPTVPMSTYIVAYMVSEFESRQSEPLPNSHVQFRVWARREALDQSDFAMRVGPRFLSFYEDFFDIKYPLPKQDLLAIPDFKISAMENWGIITFREAMLLLDDKLTSSPVKLLIANVIAHEIAHMWFGNLVTMEWWTDLWLKEGFATYMAGVCVHHEFPEWNSLDATALSNFLLVLESDGLKTSHPVSVPIEHPSTINQVFDAISYDKGSFLLRMMCLFLGEEVFRHGISGYLKKHQYKNAEQDDLWASLTEQAHRYHALPPEVTVKQIMDTWTLQTGYPLLTVTRNYETQEVTVSQKRMLSVKSDNPDDYKGSWWVPLSYSTAKEPTFSQTQPQHWFSSANESYSFVIPAAKEDWLIINNRAAGLYRVNYDNENWMMITDVLHRQHEVIDVLNRAQLVIDTMDLATLDIIDYDLAFKVLMYLRNETNVLPWRAGLSKLVPISTLLCHTSNYGVFKKFLSFLLTPIVAHYGKLTNEPDSFENAQFLSTIATYACSLNLESWGHEATQLFNQWRAVSDPDTENPIPKDVRRAVYAHAIQKGNEDEWMFLWKRYLNANLSTERNHILRALASTKSVWLLKRYLDWSLDEKSGIRKQDSFFVFNFVSICAVGYYVAKEFLFENVKLISEYLGGNSNVIGKYFHAIAAQSITKLDLDRFTEFSKTHEKLLAPGSLTVSQSLETLQGNVNWMAKYYQQISSVLMRVTDSDS